MDSFKAKEFERAFQQVYESEQPLFTAKEFERAFQHVYQSEQPLFPECKDFLKNILT